MGIEKVKITGIIGNYDKADILNKINENKVFVPKEDAEFIICKTVKKELMFTTALNDSKITDYHKTLALVGLDKEYLNRKISTLSSSECKKVAIASALLTNAQVFVFEEPTLDFAYQNVASFIKLMKNLKNNFGKTIIILSNDIEFIHKVCDNVIVIDKGKTVLEGSKYMVFKNKEKLASLNIEIPFVMDFALELEKSKGIKIGYRDEINDLIKDIYRYVK
jgi:energy-coupling factor transporter ATP-binding protein EcfA2